MVTRKRLVLFVILTLGFWAVGYLFTVCGRGVMPIPGGGCDPFLGLGPWWITLPVMATLAYLLASLFTKRKPRVGDGAA